MDLKEANLPGTMLSLFIFNLWQKAIITPALFLYNKQIAESNITCNQQQRDDARFVMSRGYYR